MCVILKNIENWDQFEINRRKKLTQTWLFLGFV